MWLRSQVSQAETLDVKISGGDRQILSGYIPQVSVLARQAIYQGIHITQVELNGENIRINLGQILKGKPLRLLEPIPVRGDLILETQDLQASLSSSLLSNALKDLLVDLLAKHGVPETAAALKVQLVVWEKVTLTHNRIEISGVCLNSNQNPKRITLAAGLELASSHVLKINSVKVRVEPDIDVDIDEFTIDLGSHVEIQQLSLEFDRMLFSGGLQVLP